VEISAKQYQKVEKAFEMLVHKVVGKIEEGEIPDNAPGLKCTKTYKLSDGKGEKKGLCC
jgi:hypothetical protein